MNKLIALAIVAVVAVSASSVNAATIPNVQFSNGQTTIDCTGGQTVNATFNNVQVGPGEVIEYIRTQVGSEPYVDTSVGGTLGIQEGSHNISASVKCPPNTGTYQLDMQTAGIYGGIRAINGGDSVNGSASFNGAIRVVASSPSTPPASSPMSWLDELIAKLIAALKPTTPAPSAACTTFLSYGYLSYGNSGSNVKAYQQFLISQGENTKATGYFGPLTLAAEAHFQSTHNCN